MCNCRFGPYVKYGKVTNIAPHLLPNYIFGPCILKNQTGPFVLPKTNPTP